MPSAIVRYIVDDVDDGILLKLQGSVDAATKLGYIGTWQQTQGPLEKRAKIFKYSVGKQVPAPIWYRFTKLVLLSIKLGADITSQSQTVGPIGLCSC